MLEERQGELKEEDLLAIYTYSYELKSRQDPAQSWVHQIYRDMNASMRKRDETALNLWRPFIFHLDKALAKLSCFTQTLWRGVGVTFDDRVYAHGEIVSWPAFSSSSLDIRVAQDFFMGKEQEVREGGTLFLLKTKYGRRVYTYSKFPEEREVLFPSNSTFRVTRRLTKEEKSQYNTTIDIVELEQVDEREFALDPASIGRIVSYMQKNLNSASHQEQGCRDLWPFAESPEHRVQFLGDGALTVVVEAMGRHPSHVGVQEHGCGILCFLCANLTDLPRFISAGAVEALQSAAFLHQAHAGVAQQACTAMRHLTAAGGFGSLGISGDVAAMVVELMLRHGQQLGVQTGGCGALHNITGHELSVGADGLRKACHVVVQAMKLHPEDAVIQEHGCGVLSRLAAVPEPWTDGGQVEATGRVLDAMLSFADRAVLQVSGCVAVHRLTAASEAQPADAERGIEALKRAMETYRQDAAVAESACGSVTYFARAAALQGLMLHSELFQCIVKAMGEHLAVQGVQDLGCGALNELMASGAEASAADMGAALEVVVKAMRQHRRHAGVQREGCTFFGRFLGGGGGLDESRGGEILERTVEAMQHHGTNVRIQECGCHVLARLAAGDARQVVSTRKAVAVGVVLAAMSRHPSQALLQQHCCVFFSMVPVDASHGLMQALKSLIEALRLHRHVEGVQLAGCSALCSCAAEASASVAMVEMGVLGVIAGGMQANRAHAAVQLHNCKALAMLGPHVTDQSDMTFVGAVSMILDAMGRFEDDAGLQRSACEALLSFLGDPARLRDMFSQSVQSTLHAMKLHPEDAVIQEHGCGVLSRLAAVPEPWTDGGQVEATGRVLDAMLSFADRAVLQVSGCVAVHRLTAASEAQPADAERGIEALKRAMETYRQDAAVAESACGSVTYFARAAALQGLMLHSELFQCIVKAMGEHLAVQGVQDLGCGALNELMASGAEASAADMGAALEVVVKAMRQHRRHAGVQREGCTFFGRFLGGGGGLDESRGGEILERTVEAMQHHGTNVRIQECGCYVLARLAAGDAALPALLAPDSMQVLLDAMAAQSQNVPLLLDGCGVLEALASHAPSQHHIVASGGPAAMVAALRQHPLEEALQELGCTALCRIAAAEGGPGALAEADAAQALVASMGQYPGHGAMQAHGCRALRLLAHYVQQRSPTTPAPAAGHAHVSVEAASREQVAGAHEAAPPAEAPEPIQPPLPNMSGAVRVLLAALQQHPEQPSLAEDVCRALGHLLVDPRTAPALVEAGAVDHLLGLMRSSLAARPLLEAATAVLCVVLEDVPAVAGPLAASGAVSLTVSTLQRHKDSGDLQQHGCRMLRVLLDPALTGAGAFAEQAVETVLQAMWRHPDRSQLQAAACGILRAVSSAGNGVELLATAGAIRPVTGAMQRHPQESDIQEPGCALLGQFVAVDRLIARVLEAGGVQAILQAMQQQPHATGVQATGCAALQRLAGHVALWSGAEGLDAGVALLEVLRVHVTDAAIPGAACAVLCRLAAAAPDLQPRLAAPEALQSVLGALQTPAPSPELLADGCALLCLVLGGREGDSPAPALPPRLLGDLCAVGLAALQCSPAPEGPQAAACTLLAILSGTGAGRQTICRLGAAGPVLQAMAQGGAALGLQRAACRLLYHLRDRLWPGPPPPALEPVVAPPEPRGTSPPSSPRPPLSPRPGACPPAPPVGSALVLVVQALHRHPDCERLQTYGTGVLLGLRAHAEAWRLLPEAVPALVDGMRRHGPSAAVQAHACSLLALLAAEPALCGRIAVAGGVAAVCGAMGQHAADPALQESGCAALQHLASPGGADGDEAAARAVLQAMQGHRGHAPCQEQACTALWAWAEDGERRAALRREGALEAVQETLAHNTEPERLQSLALRALARLTLAGADGLKAAARADLVLQAMRAYGGSAAVQAHAAGVLWHAALAEGGAGPVVAAGAVEVLVVALRAHAEPPELHVHACGALGCVAAHGHAAGVAAAGGLLAVLSSLDRHQGDALVVEEGLGLLRALVELRAQELVAADGVRVVVRAMRRHGAEGALQAQGCAVLGQLMLLGVEAGLLAEAGAMGAVAEALAAHADRAELPSVGLEVLRALTAAPQHCSAADTPVVCKAVLRGMRASPGDAALQAKGCTAAHHLSRAPGRAPAVAETGLISAMLGAMGQHAADACVQEQACGAIWHLSLDAGSQGRVAGAGAHAGVLRAMQGHRGRPGVQQAGCGVLQGLAAAPDSLSLLLAAGAVRAVAEALQAHAAHLGVQVQGMAALHALALTPEGAQAVGRAQGAELALQAMHGHRAELPAQETGCRLLQALAGEGAWHETPRDCGLEAVLAAAQRFPDAPALLRAVCGVLGWLPARGDAAAPAPELEAVLGMLRRHPADRALQEAGLHALHGLVPGPCAPAGVPSEAIGHAVVASMRLGPDCPGVQERGCRVLRRLLGAPQGQEAVLQTGALALVWAALRRHPAHAALQEAGCDVLAALDLTHVARPASQTDDTVAGLVSAMRHHIADARFLERACDAVRALAREDAWQQQLLGAGALDVVTEGLQMHLGSPELQEHATAALVCLSRPPGLAAPGVAFVEAVIAAMDRNCTHAAVQANGCAVLAHAAAAVGASEELCTAAAACAVAALAHHAAAVDVVCQAMTALSCAAGPALASWPVGEVEAAALVAAFARHAAHPDVHLHGCRALRCLAQSPGARAALTAKGAGGAVLQAMARHLPQVDLQEAACRALQALLEDPALLGWVAGADALQGVLQALHRHPAQAGLQHQGLAVLCRMAAAPAAVPRLRAVGACLVARRSVEQAPDHELVRQEGERLLWALREAGAGVGARTGLQADFQLIVATMQQHPSVQLIQADAVQALLMFSGDSECCRAMATRAIAEAMSKAMARGGKHRHVQAGGCRLLNRLLDQGLQDLDLGLALTGGLKMMQGHPLDAEVQAEGSQLLCRLSHAAGELAEPSRVRSVTAVMKALQGHPLSGPVQMWGSQVLSHVAEAPELCPGLREAGAGLALLDALARHAAAAEVVRAAAAALGLLIAAEPAAYPGAWEALAAALQRHAGDAGVVQHCCAALCPLTGGGLGLAAAVVAELVPPVLDGLHQQPHDPDVQAQGCRLLCSLGPAAVGGHAVAHPERWVALLDTLRASCAEAAQEEVCSLVHTLALTPAGAPCLAEAAVQTAVEGMRRHTPAVGVQEKGCEALLAWAERALDAAAAGGGVGAVVAAMQQHPAQASLQELGCRALRALLPVADAPLEVHGNGAFTLGSAAGGLALRPAAETPDVKVLAAVVQAMQLQPTHRDLQALGCGLLRDLLGSAECRVWCGVEGPGAAVLASVLQRYPQCPATQGPGSQALCLLAAERAAHAALWAAQGVEAVRTVLRCGDARTQCNGCGAVANLAAGPEAALRLVAAGVRGDVAGAMSRALRQPEVQLLGCIALWKLGAATNTPMAPAPETAVLAAVVAAMQAHPTDCSLQGHACHALLSFLGASRDVLDQTPAVVTLVLAAMRAHPADPRVQEKGCQVLLEVRGQGPGPGAAAAVDGGALEVVVAGMYEHAAHAAIQEAACGVLLWLVGLPALEEWSLTATVTLPVQRALARHPGSRALQDVGTTLLARFGLPPPNPATPVTYGLTTVIQEMEQPQASAGTLALACRIVQHLADTDALCPQEVGRAMRLVAEAMQRHPRDAALAEHACRALGALASHADAADRTPAVETVVGVMQLHMDRPGVQEEGCRALHRLLSPPHPQPGVPRAVEAVLGAMRRFEDCARVQEHGAAAMLGLVALGADAGPGAEPLIEAGALRVLAQAMTQHAEDAGVQQQCCRALRTLGAQRGPNLRAAVMQALQRHTDHWLLQADGCAVLRALAGGWAAAPGAAACALGLAVAAVTRHGARRSVVVEACWLAVRIAGKEGVPVEAEEARGLAEGVLRALRAHPHDEALQEAGFAALEAVPVLGAGAATRIAAALAEALQQYASNTALLSYGLGALLGLVRATPQPAELQAVAAAALPAVVHAMGQPPPKGLQAQGRSCALLRHCGMPCPADLAPERLVTAVLDAIRQHRDPPAPAPAPAPAREPQTAQVVELQEDACHVLSAVMASAAALPAPLMAEAWVEVAASLQCHMASPAIRGPALALLAALLRAPWTPAAPHATAAADAILQALQHADCDAGARQHCCAILHGIGAVLPPEQATRAAAVLVTTLQHHREHAALQALACAALQTLAEAPEARALMLQADAVHVVVAVMQRHLQSEAVQQHGCRLLQALVMEAGEDLAGPLEVVTRSLGAFPEHAQLQEDSCRALLLIVSAQPSYRSLVAQGGGFDEVVSAMARHVDSPALQEHAARLVGALAQACARAGPPPRWARACDALLAAMRRHPASLPVQDAACGAVRTLIREMAEWPGAAGQEALVDALVETMRCHSAQAALQREACEILCHLAAAPVLQEPRLGHVVGALVAMLEAHQANEAVQEAGCRCLGRVAAHGPASRARLADDWAMVRLLEALWLHPDSAALQGEACGVLRHLAADPALRPRLCDMGAPGRVVAAMLRFPRSAALQRDGCAALWGLSSLCNAAGLPAVLAALQHHPQDRAVLLPGVGALAAWAGRADTRPGAARPDTVAAVLQAMQQEPGHAALQEACCAFAAALAADPSARLHVTSAPLPDAPPELALPPVPATAAVPGVAWRVLGALQRHPWHAGVQAAAPHALTQLLQTREAWRWLQDEGGLAGLVAGAMRQHPDSAAVQGPCCRALCALLDGACPPSEYPGLAPLLWHALARHEGLLDVQAPAAAALWALLPRAGHPPCPPHAVAAAIAAMRAHPLHAGLQADGTGLLVCAVRSPAAFPPALRAAALEAVFAAMGSPEAAAATQEHGLRLLADTSLRPERGEFGPRAVAAVVRAMAQHLPATALVEAGCRFLCHAAASPALRAELATSGALGVLCNAMRTHRQHPVVQLHSCETLRALAADDAVRAAVLRAGGSLLAVEVLRQHAQSGDVWEVAMATLRALVPGTAVAGFAAVMAAMQEHLAALGQLSSRAPMARASLCAAVLLTLELHPGAKLRRFSEELILHYGIEKPRGPVLGLGPVLQLMLQSPADAGVQRDGCRFMRCVLAAAAAPAPAFADAGAIPAVLRALQRHRDDRDVADGACGLLQAAADLPALRWSAVNGGAVEQVLRAMVAHQQDPGLQERACGALQALAGGAQLAELATAECLAALLGALQAHRAHTGLQRAVSELGLSPVAQLMLRSGTGLAVHMDGCRFMQCALSALAAPSQAFAEAGAIKAIVQALQAHAADGALARRACELLRAAAELPQLQWAMVTAGAVWTILKAMVTHREEVGIQETACGLLQLLAGEETALGELAHTEYVDALLGALRAHPDSRSIRGTVCALMSRIVEHIQREDAGEAWGLVVAAMQEHTDQSEVQAMGCKTMGTIAHCLAADWDWSIGTEALLMAMKRYPDDAALQGVGCWAISKLTEIAPCRPCLVSAGARALMVGVRQRHVGHLRVQEHCSIALAKLPERSPDKGVGGKGRGARRSSPWQGNRENAQPDGQHMHLPMPPAQQCRGQDHQEDEEEDSDNDDDDEEEEEEQEEEEEEDVGGDWGEEQRRGADWERHAADQKNRRSKKDENERQTRGRKQRRKRGKKGRRQSPRAVSSASPVGQRIGDPRNSSAISPRPPGESPRTRQRANSPDGAWLTQRASLEASLQLRRDASMQRSGMGEGGQWREGADALQGASTQIDALERRRRRMQYNPSVGVPVRPSARARPASADPLLEKRQMRQRMLQYTPTRGSSPRRTRPPATPDPTARRPRPPPKSPEPPGDPGPHRTPRKPPSPGPTAHPPPVPVPTEPDPLSGMMAAAAQCDALGPEDPADGDLLEYIVKTMRSHALREGVQEYGCRALHALARHPQGRAGTVGVVEAVVQAMKLFDAHETIQRLGVELLQQLLPALAPRMPLGTLRGVSLVVVLAMRTHGYQPLLQQSACGLLAVLAAREGPLQEESASWVDAVVAAMQAHAANPEVQLWGCRALVPLLRLHGPAAGAGAGAEVVAEALRQHQPDTRVLEAACEALQALYAGGCPAERRTVALLTRAMGQHLQSAALQAHGCGALHALARAEGGHAAVQEAVGAVTAALQAHPSCPTVQAQGLGMLQWALEPCHGPPEAGAALVAVVVKALGRYEGDAGVQAPGVQVLRHLAAQPDNHLVLGDEGAVQVLVAAARQALRQAAPADAAPLQATSGHAACAHATAVSVVEVSCAALADIADGAQGAARVGAGGATEVVLEAMGRHAGRAVLQEQGCRLLAALLAWPQWQGLQQALEAALAAMAGHSAAAAVQASACRVLLGLVAAGAPPPAPPAAAVCAAAGAALEAHPGDAGLVADCCRLLAHFTCDAGPPAAAAATWCLVPLAMGAHPTDLLVQGHGARCLAGLVRQGLGDGQWVVVLMRALQEHPRAEGVLRHSLAALHGLASAAGAPGRCCMAKGSASVAQAMRDHPRHRDIQRHGCALLCAIAQETAAAREMVASGALSPATAAVLDAMRGDSEGGDVRDGARAALRGLALGVYNRALPAEGQAAAAAAAAARLMRQWATNRAIQAHGCAALQELACVCPTATSGAEAVAVPAVLSAMQEHPDHQDIHDAGGALLRGWAQQPPTRCLIDQHRGVAILLRSLRAQADSAPAQEHGCAVLAALAAHLGRAKAILEDGGLDVALAALRRHTGAAAVQEQGCELVGQLVTQGGRREEAHAAGAVEAVQAAAAQHPSHSGVQASAARALRCLASRANSCDDAFQRTVALLTSATPEAKSSGPGAPLKAKPTPKSLPTPKPKPKPKPKVPALMPGKPSALP